MTMLLTSDVQIYPRRANLQLSNCGEIYKIYKFPQMLQIVAFRYHPGIGDPHRGFR
ncbi:hypothetical protein [Microcoleus sp. FACHB-831]|uniref:hypothetical protein n=1 Tax=Microcoleus sp. FACHB-831 TaxID=2692827 RepID=UPI001A7E6D09|nr:hypothetical protein [Microcoleus sp. FACHB-831]